MDLISLSIVLGKESEVVHIARYIYSYSNDLPVFIRLLSYEIIKDYYDVDMKPFKDIINNDSVGFIRRKIRLCEFDPVSWVDLSRHYISIGNEIKARRAMLIAIGIAPVNRFVLRSAVRLFVHLGEVDYAHSILRKNIKKIKNDPWLLSAEISVASLVGKTSNFIKDGKLVIENKNYTQYSLSELLSALGTLELSYGFNKKGKNLLKKSLITPNDNVVAQASWVNSQIEKIEIDEDILNTTPLLHEAKSTIAMQENNWQIAVENLKNWQVDEPFASRPSIHGSFIALSYLDDYSLAEEFSRNGLIVDENNSTLINNLSVSLIHQGKIDEAKQELKKIKNKINDFQSIGVYSATSGLLYYKEGNKFAGKEKYFEAIDIFRNNNIPKQIILLAYICLMKEEIKINNSVDVEIINGFAKDYRKGEFKDIDELLEKIQN